METDVLTKMGKKGLSMVFGAAIVSGFSIFINSFGVRESNPFLFTFLKNTVVAILLFSIIVLFKNWGKVKELNKKQLGYLAMIGLIGGSVPFLLFFKGLQISAASSASFIHKTMFLLVAVMSILFLRERFNKKIVLGALAIVAGNFLLLKFAFNNFTFGLGEILIFAATLFWATEILIAKHALTELNLDPKIVAFGRMFIGSFFIFLFLLFSGQLHDLSSITLSNVYWIALTVPLLLAYQLFWYSGLKETNAVVASSILVLSTVITTTLFFIFGKSPVSILQIIGILLLMIGASLMVFIDLKNAPHFRDLTARGG